nr:MAG TPA: hypothetical protein [Caudoviricetes sp.]
MIGTRPRLNRIRTRLKAFKRFPAGKRPNRREIPNTGRI